MMRALIVFSVLLLSGCVSLLPEPPPPPRLYALDAGAVARLEGARLDAAIAIAAPVGERALMGADLVWRTGDQVAFVARTQWSQHAGEALRSLLVETMTRQGGFNAVMRQGVARGDYELRWEVIDFEIRDASMSARFVADVSLIAAASGRVLASETIVAEAPVAARSASAAAEALTRAAREGGARIGVFAAGAAGRAQAQASAASINR